VCHSHPNTRMPHSRWHSALLNWSSRPGAECSPLLASSSPQPSHLPGRPRNNVCGALVNPKPRRQTTSSGFRGQGSGAVYRRRARHSPRTCLEGPETPSVVHWLTLSLGARQPAQGSGVRVPGPSALLRQAALFPAGALFPLLGLARRTPNRRKAFCVCVAVV
jgi:hypothetical protein